MKRRDLKPIILEESRRLFEERGFDSVTVNDICAACDITKPTFYKYAANKADLLRHFFEDIALDVDASWADKPNWYECICTGFSQYLEHFIGYGLDFCQQLYIQNIHSPDDTFHIDDAFKEKMIHCIEEAQKAGEILAMAPAAELFQVIKSVMVGYAGNWIINDGKTDILEGFTSSLATICEVAQ